MKKLLCVFIYLIAFTAIMGGILTACSDQPEEGTVTPVNELTEYSAINIDDSIKETIGVESGEMVIRVFNTYTLFLGDHDTIETALKTLDFSDIYYVVVQDSRNNGGYLDIASYRCNDAGEINKFNLGNVLYDDMETLDILLNNTFADQLPEGAKVLDVYYLLGTKSHGSSVLYYVTDMGDFVYYKSYRTYNVLGKEQTFFTESEFFDLMRAALKAEREAWGYTDERNWLPIVIGAGAAVVVAGGAVGIVIYKKKKKAKENVNPEISAPETNP